VVTLDEVIAGKRVCVCGGSGGVGKTTMAAAIAAGMAARGLRVAVVTIDPARRLATALGLSELGNEPHVIDPTPFAAAGLPLRGELSAMMLDAKRTFDELIERLAPDARTRDDVLSNRIYQELSTAVAGSQEFTAIAKLYELHQEGGFDLIVLDTPPSRNALDFLDAPERLTHFFEGRAIQVLLRPAGLGMRLMGRGTGLLFSVLKRVTGVDLLEDLSVFFRSLGGLIDGFRARAAGVNALLEDTATTFVLVTSPEREPIDEALFFWRRLRAAGMPFGAVVVNKVHEADEGADGPLAPTLAPRLGDALAGRVARTLADYRVLAERDRANIARLAGELGHERLLCVPHLDEDVHDAAGVVRLARCLFEPRGRAAAAREQPAA
jgi:anion-transporting  ArsA/GET3 family ATPase